MKCFSLFVLIFSILLLSACSNKSVEQTDWDRNNIREINSEDIRIQNAIKLAQDSIGFFVNYFNFFSSDTNYTFFIKSKFVEEGIIEHIWSKPIKVNSKGFISIIDNVPSKLRSFKYKDTVEIFLKNVEDFIITTPDSWEIGNYFKAQFGK